jgi:hypothetical protein
MQTDRKSTLKFGGSSQLKYQTILLSSSMKMAYCLMHRHFEWEPWRGGKAVAL